MDIASELRCMQRDYGEFEELSPPDVPRRTFVRWCIDAWYERCEREQAEKKSSGPPAG